MPWNQERSRTLRVAAKAGAVAVALLTLSVLTLFVLTLTVLMPATRSSAVPADEVPLADVLEIIVLERQLLAIDANSGGQTTENLELKESVIWHESRGKVGVVLTDRRILAVSDRSAAWQEERYRRTEQVPATAILGDRLAIVTTSERVIGFNATSGNLVEVGLGPRETVVASRIGENIAVVVTSRRALGLSPQRGGFFPIKVDLSERIDEVSARSNVATVKTNRRILIFRGPTGTWEERRLDLR